MTKQDVIAALEAHAWNLSEHGLIKLNLGCGRRHEDDFINVDMDPQCVPDQLVDLESFPWPWPNDSVSEIHLVHSLEHLGETKAVRLAIMTALYRVLVPGGAVKIVVPHPRSNDFLGDPTHVWPIDARQFSLFSQRENRRTTAAGYANTPLGLQLGVDFRVKHVAVSLAERWHAAFLQKEIDEADLAAAVDLNNNVLKEMTIILEKVWPPGSEDDALSVNTPPEVLEDK